MQIGTAIIAPNGFGLLEANLTYYFLRNHSVTHTVHLVLFVMAKGAPLAHRYSLSREKFEMALANNHIIEAPTQDGAPPFLAARCGKDLARLDLHCENRKRRKGELARAEERLGHIAPLLENAEQILAAQFPEKEINKYAVKAGLNAQRIRLWFFLYLCFGRSIWTLAPRYFNCGRWSRLDRAEGPKFGRKSISRGANAGYRLNTEATDLIIRSYKRHSKPGKTMTAIYRLSMVEDFKAAVTLEDNGRKRLVSNGEIPIPTLDQYRYQVNKLLGRNTVLRQRWGEDKHRRLYAAHKGKFSNSVSNLLERVELDAYKCNDMPKSYIDDEPLPALYVTRIIDTASALRLGIGFSLGAENSDAYNMARFCCAISKKKFCSLFGIEIEESEWPSQGLPPHRILDRGPGIKDEPGLDSAKETGKGLGIREMTLSGKGQSKAIVESSQRRETKVEGPRKTELSDLTPTQMARREIERLRTENETSNATEHMTPDMHRQMVAPNPKGVWNYLDARARNDAEPITFDDAVRQFLRKTTVTLGRDGITMSSQRYNSETLRQSGALEGVTGRRQVEAFILPLCVRYIWVCVGKDLIEVEAQLNLRDDEEMLFRSDVELKQEAQLLKHSQAEQRLHREAVAVERIGQFEHETGGKWESNRTVPRIKRRRERSQSRIAKDTKALLTGN